METLAAAKMKATTTVTLFIITVLVAVGWSTVEVNASEEQELADSDKGQLADSDKELADSDKELADSDTVEPTAAELATTAAGQLATTEQEQHDLAEAIELEYNSCNRNNNICYRYHLVEKLKQQQQQQQRKHEQCCVLFHKRQPPRKMGDIWIAVGLSTVFLFFMVLILQVFRNLEGQRKSCRKAHPVPIDDPGGLTNLLG